MHTNNPTMDCPRQGGAFSSPRMVPFCQTKQEDSIPKYISALHQQYQNILDMNGVFLHRGMLCLLQQPPLSDILVKSVWRVLDNSTSLSVTLAITRTILATALLQLSGRPPLLFPSRIAPPTNETKAYNDNWHYLMTRKETERLDAIAATYKLVQQSVLVSLLGFFGTGLAANAQSSEVAPYWCASQKKVDDVFFMSDMPWDDGNRQSKC
jgi:hypothetical protein